MDSDRKKEMEEIKEITGISISTQINLKLKGYKIVKVEK